MTKSKSAKTAPEQHVFEADVSRLLHMMVHSVYQTLPMPAKNFAMRPLVRPNFMVMTRPRALC